MQCELYQIDGKLGTPYIPSADKGYDTAAIFRAHALLECKKHSNLILYIMNHVSVLNSHLCLRTFNLPKLA